MARVSTAEVRVIISSWGWIFFCIRPERQFDVSAVRVHPTRQTIEDRTTRFGDDELSRRTWEESLDAASSPAQRNFGPASPNVLQERTGNADTGRNSYQTSFGSAQPLNQGGVIIIAFVYDFKMSSLITGFFVYNVVKIFLKQKKSSNT
jgi:hypothetical protein